MHLGLTAGFGDGEFDDAVGVGDLGAEAERCPQSDRVTSEVEVSRCGELYVALGREHRTGVEDQDVVAGHGVGHHDGDAEQGALWCFHTRPGIGL